MAILPGRRLGPYEILSAIGAGGMGEVYRARDSKLGRDVALKVLPAAFAADADRMARFEREARLLAALNHPHIAAIYGLEESSGTPVLVMELVVGPTLADRIANGAIPLEEALPIAKQIADALEYAHEKGVIHRDLKPANIKVKPDGTVKVLDFGLAKALTEDSAAVDMNNSPTLSMGATVAGVILGTAAYMSPEQAKGKPADRRADIWAYGVVLCEMLSGKRLYTGETAAETLAAVLMKEPALDGLPANTPAAIRNLLRRCLERDPRRRLPPDRARAGHPQCAVLRCAQALAEQAGFAVCWRCTRLELAEPSPCAAQLVGPLPDDRGDDHRMPRSDTAACAVMAVSRSSSQASRSSSNTVMLCCLRSMTTGRD